MCFQIVIQIKIFGYSSSDNNDNKKVCQNKFGESMQYICKRTSQIAEEKISRSAEDDYQSNIIENVS